MKYIHHHLGLGDHIICNGLVRHYKEIYGEVTVFCDDKNFKNVLYMYRDDDNINVLPIKENGGIPKYISKNKLESDVITVGFDLLKWGVGTFDEGFYDSVNVPFNFRFTKFFFSRDSKKEEEVYNLKNPNNDRYIFFHGKIDKKKVRNDLMIIENPDEYGIFDILKLIENAEEVHLMESSIKNLVNSINMDKPTFFYHKYVRKGYESPFYNAKGLNNFEIKI